MIYQMIYGKHPSLGYRELKYSVGIIMDEYLDNRLFDAFKAKFGLSDYIFDNEAELPTCIYFISSDYDSKSVSFIGKVSLEQKTDEICDLSHFYVFTSFDAYDAVAANTQSSVFNLKTFVQSYRSVSAYDVDSNKIFNANNTFSIEVIKSSLECMGIDRKIFKNILHKLFLSIQSNKKIFIVSGENTSAFTKNALNLMRGIFYILPNCFLNNFGFITYMRYISDNHLLHESTKIAVIDNNEKNRDEYTKQVDYGNFIIDFEYESDDEYYGAGLFLDLMASIIFDNVELSVLEEFYIHVKQYLKESSNKDYRLYELLYKHYAFVVAKSEEFSIKDIYNELLEHAEKLHDSIFKEVSIDALAALKESIENVNLESEKTLGIESIFVKLKTISNYSIEMFTDESFLIFLKYKLMQAFDSADYLLLKDYYTLSTKLEFSITDTTVIGNLKKMKEEIINNTFSTIKSQDISRDNKTLIESWNDELIGLLDDVNKKKIFDVLISKSLAASLNSPYDFNELLIGNKNQIKASGYLNARLADYSEVLVNNYKSCVDAKEIRIYFQIFAIIFEDNTELFKIIFDKDGLYDLLIYIKILEDKSNSEDLNFIGEVLENFNSSKMKKDIKSFFVEEKYKSELEKAARIDKNIDSFAKKFKLFDTGKKGWFSKS